MEYTITTCLRDNVLEIAISGSGGRENADAIAQDVIAAIRTEQAGKILIDVRPFQGRMGVADTFFHVRRYPLDLRHVRTAVIDLKEHSAFTSFFETTASTLGFSIRYFNEIPDALAWLQSESSA
ncbi:MAG: STAS/SEC14 domain-containing protein [Nitrospirae bacterium]|nr:MAG: STAS/SEC14 domain-containing protein [Nitrospirota bacterium]